MAVALGALRSNRGRITEETIMRRTLAVPLGIAALALPLWSGLLRADDELQEQREAARQALASALRDYEKAKASGALVDACINAGFLATVYRALGERASEQRWARTEAADCARAGRPHARTSDVAAPAAGESK